MSLKQAKLIILAIWMVGLLNGLPPLGAMKIVPDKKFNCKEMFPKKIYRQLYTVLNLLLFYFIPLMFITPLYVKMIFKLR